MSKSIRFKAALFANVLLASFMVFGWNSASALVSPLPGKWHNCSHSGYAGANDYSVKVSYDKDTKAYKVKPHMLYFDGHSLAEKVKYARVSWYITNPTTKKTQELGTNKVYFSPTTKRTGDNGLNMDTSKYSWTTYGQDRRPYYVATLYKDANTKYCSSTNYFRPDVNLPY